MDTKWCYKCKRPLPIDRFGSNHSKRDGLSTECRECKRAQDRQYFHNNREACLTRMAEYRLEHREELRARALEYSRSTRGREVNNVAKRRYYYKHHDVCLARMKLHRQINAAKYIARYTISNAVKLGKVTRPNTCSACNKPCNVHAHHDNYSKPLDVRWLCRKCHGRIHRKRQSYEQE